MELPEREIAEVGVVRCIRMGRQEGSTSAAPSPLTRVQGPSIVTRPLARGSTAPPSVTSSDARGSRSKFLVCSASRLIKEDRGSVLKGHGHERTVGVADRLQRKGAERPGRDLGGQCSRVLRMRRRRVLMSYSGSGASPDGRACASWLMVLPDLTRAPSATAPVVARYFQPVDLRANRGGSAGLVGAGSPWETAVLPPLRVADVLDMIVRVTVPILYLDLVF